MKRRTLSLLFVLGALTRALGSDSDLDGVDDARDRCPDTPFDQTVTRDGCPETSHPVATMIGIGSTYTTGTYGGTTSTDALSANLSAAIFSGNFYVSAMGGYYFFGANDQTVANSSDGGVADVYLGSGYTLSLGSRLTLTPAIHFKAATADTTIGTGENDYGASILGVFQVGKSDLFLQYGYTVTGDSNVTYRDVSFGSAGVTLHPAPRGSLVFSYDFSQTYLPDLPDVASLSVLGSYMLDDARSLQLNYSYGLSDSASEHLLGITLFSRF